MISLIVVCIGEARMYLGLVEEQFECHLASVQPKCIWIGLRSSLNVIWDMEAQVYLVRLDDNLNVIWHR